MVMTRGIFVLIVLYGIETMKYQTLGCVILVLIVLYGIETSLADG